MLYIASDTGLRIEEVDGLSYGDTTETTLSVNRGYDYNHTHDLQIQKTRQVFVIYQLLLPFFIRSNSIRY